MMQAETPNTRPNQGEPAARVLLVEDEVLVRDMVRVFLERAGYSVVALATAEEAMEGEHVTHADLLLTDVMLRGKTGVDLANALRARVPGLKVVYMSGNVADDAARESVVSPDARFLAKPFTRTMLLEAVRSLASSSPTT
ncbi:MAG: response regulator [Vicinamibacterales bacterium]